MTYQEFKNKYAGKGIDFDGYYGFQCMDLAHQYATEVVGHDIPNGNAKDMWNYNIDGYEKISNSPTGVPSQGDIVIWGTGVGQYGHIAVFDNGDQNKFQSFDQNWPLNSICHIQDHNYYGVLGWFHPKSQTLPFTPDHSPNYQKGSGKFDQVVRKEHDLKLIDYDNPDRYYDNDDVINAIQKLYDENKTLKEQPTVTVSTTPTTTTTTTVPLQDTTKALKEIINAKWTWIGVNGWKNRLAQLKKLV